MLKHEFMVLLAKENQNANPFVPSRLVITPVYTVARSKSNPYGFSPDRTHQPHACVFLAVRSHLITGEKAADLGGQAAPG